MMEVKVSAGRQQLGARLRARTWTGPSQNSVTPGSTRDTTLMTDMSVNI